MNRTIYLPTAFLVLAFAIIPLMASAQAVDAELGAYWQEAARTVAEGDFEGYSGLYHDDAVLVSLAENTSYSIVQALNGWKYLFDDTRDGKATASLEVRFTQTLHDEATAHQTGMFRYMFVPVEGDSRVTTVHFQSLFVKKDRWLMLMEYQLQPATDEEWEAAK